MWRDLHATRSGSGFGANAISYLEIEAYLRLTEEALEPWELHAIRAVDSAYMVSLVADTQGEGNG